MPERRGQDFSTTISRPATRTPAARKKKRHVNGKVELKMPLDVLRKKCQAYMRNGKPVHRSERIHETAYSIVAQFQAEYRGLGEYYELADNLHRITHLEWVM